MALCNQASDGRITVLRANGRLTFPEICTKMVDFLFKNQPSHVLCDFTKATVGDLTTSEIENIFKLAGHYANGLSGLKAAIVAHGSVDFGLAHMFSIFSEIAELPVKVRAFRTTEVARTWLAE